jgi:hypothetical protein
MFSVMAKEALAFNNCHFKDNSNLEQCSAPAPDSIKIITIGGDFVELGWLPAWEGARQNVEVFVKTNQTYWTPQYVLDSVVGSSIVLAGLDLTQEYGVKISTFCPSGELSNQSKLIDGINLIIDLAVVGRNPVNPTIVNCKNISLTNKWIGFRIGYLYQGIQISNTFEFYPILPDNPNNSISEVEIRRVTTNHPIVACEKALPNRYPNNFLPIIENVGSPIKIDRLINNGNERFFIGMVGISLTASTVSLCPDPNFPWGQNHTFNTLISNQQDFSPDIEIQERSDVNNIEDLEIDYVNPISNRAIFRVNEMIYDNNNDVSIIIVDQQGRIVLERKSQVANGVIELDVEGLNPGYLTFLFTLNNRDYAIPIIKQ